MSFNPIYLYINKKKSVVPHSLSCFKVLHYYHLVLCRANAAWHAVEIYVEKNEMVKSIMKRQIFFIYLSFRIVFFFLFCFVFKKMSFWLPIFVHIGKRSNSRSQMSFKTGVLKHLAKVTGKHLCWSLFLIKLQDWRPVFSSKKRL